MVRSGILTLGLALMLSGAGAQAQETRVQVTEQGTTLRGPTWAESVTSPMQEFVSHQVHEILDLSRHIEPFRAGSRPELVRVVQHMIRDHTLVKDAARNVLARQGKESKPVRMEMMPMTEGPEAFIDHQLQMHEQHLARAQQLLAQAGTPEERSVYQQAVRDTRKHLGWLRRLDQGQPVQIGAFGPTTPLARIAGYREELGSGSARRRSGSRAAGRRQRR